MFGLSIPHLSSSTCLLCLLRVLAVLPYHNWSPPAYTRELEERINRCSLWPSQEATQCHCRELDRTPHLYLVWKVGCKEVIDCIKSGTGGGKQSHASLHRHPLGLAALFALSCIAWLPTTHRLCDSVLESLDHRWDQATAHLTSEMAVCNDREACEQRKQEQQERNET